MLIRTVSSTRIISTLMGLIHILDPSPQRTPFLFQAGTSTAGVELRFYHAEAIFVAGTSPEAVARKVKLIREEAAKRGRDPNSIKIFPVITPIS